MKKILAPVAVIVVAVLISGIFIANKKEPEENVEDRKYPIVQLDEITPRTIALKVASQGVLSPRFNTTLAARVTGNILEIKPSFLVGNQVQEGAVLTVIDPFDYEVLLEQAKSRVASAQAKLALEEAQAKVAEKEWQQLRGNSGISPTDLALRRPQIQQARAELKASNASYKQAQKNLEYTVVRAPFDAVITERAVSPGSFVTTGSPIGTLLSTDTAEVRLPITDAELTLLDDKVLDSQVYLSSETITSAKDADTGRRLSNGKTVAAGTVVRLEGTVDETNRMQTLIAEIKNPYEVSTVPLAFGMFLQATVLGRTVENAIEIPRAMLDEQGTTRLPVIDVEKSAKSENSNIYSLELLPVEVHQFIGAQAVISADFKPSHRLIRGNLEFALEGLEVKVKDVETEQ